MRSIMISPKEAIETCKDDVVLFPPVFKGDYVPDDFYRDVVSRQAERFGLLHSRGYVPLVAFPQWTPELDTRPRAYRRYAQFMESELPGSTLEVEVEYSTGRFHWLRDLFQQFGNTTLIRRNSADRPPRSLLHALGFDDAETCPQSDLGEGGYFVRLGKDLFVSQDADFACSELLESDGYKIHKMPTTNNLPSPRPRNMAEHIDLEFNMCRASDGEPMILANEAYYGVFQDAVDNAVETLGAQLFIVPEGDETDTMSVNFISLPRGEIMLPDSCPETAAFLKRYLGETHVLEAPFDYWRDTGTGGGLRCMTNVLGEK